MTLLLNIKLFFLCTLWFYISSNPLKYGQSDPCKGLVLSSGGSRGAYHAGVLKGLTQSLPAEEIQWDIVSGVSAGAINTLSALMFNKGEEAEWANYLIDSWTNLKSSDVYQEWTFHEIEGLLVKSGIYDNSPLKNYLTNEIIKAQLDNPEKKIPSDRKAIFSATDISSGEQYVWTEENDTETIVGAVLASSAIPAVFPVAQVGDGEYLDGSVFSAVNILSVVDRCMSEKSSNPNEITIDIILCTPLELKDEGPKFSSINSLHILLRANYLATYANTKMMIETAKLLHPDVNFRFIIAPEKSIDNMGLDFSKESLKKVIDLGQRDAFTASNKFHLEEFKKKVKYTDL